MSETTLTFTYRRNGIPVDVTSAVFRDPTDSYGVRRTDNNAVVVAAGVALDHDGTGQYSYTFTDPAPDLTYEYYIEWVYNGLTNRAAFTKTASSGGSPAVGRYASQANIEDIFGVEAIAEWSALESSSSSPDVVRIQQALDYADGEIDTRLRGGPYVVPLALFGDSVNTVRDWAAKLAGLWLLDSRGERTGGTPVMDYQTMRQEVLTAIELALSDPNYLDATLAAAGAYLMVRNPQLFF